MGWWKRLVKANSNTMIEATDTTNQQRLTLSMLSKTKASPTLADPAGNSSTASYGTFAQAPPSFTSPPPRWPALFSASSKSKESTAAANRKSYEDLLEESNINKEQFHLATIKIDRLQGEMEWMESHIQSRERLLSDAKAALNVQQRRNEELAEEIEIYNKYIKMREDEVEFLRREMMRKDASASEADGEHAMRWRKYDELVDRLQAQVEQVLAQVEVVQEEVLVKDAAISMLSDNVMESKGKDEEIARLRKLLEERDEEVEGMKKTLKERDEDISGIKAGKEEVLGLALIDGVAEFANL